jgi:hypothetical protein
MRLRLSVVNVAADGFPFPIVARAFRCAWSIPGHHIDMPRTHPAWGPTNGGSIDAPGASVTQILQKLEQLQRPRDLQGEALVMIDAEWSLPSTRHGRAFLRQIGQHIENHMLPDSAVGLYGYIPEGGELRCACVPMYCGKPVQYLGHPRSDFWRPSELDACARNAVSRLLAAVKSERRVLVINPRPYGTFTDWVMRGDYITAAVEAAVIGAATDVLVWVERKSGDILQDKLVIQFLEDLAALVGRGTEPAASAVAAAELNPIYTPPTHTGTNEGVGA